MLFEYRGWWLEATEYHYIFCVLQTGFYMLCSHFSWSWWCTHILSIRYSDWARGSCSRASTGMTHGRCPCGSHPWFCTLGSSFQKRLCEEDSRTPLQVSASSCQRGSTRSRTLRPARWTLKSTSIRSLILKMMMMMSLLSRKCSSSLSMCVWFAFCRRIDWQTFPGKGLKSSLLSWSQVNASL